MWRTAVTVTDSVDFIVVASQPQNRTSRRDIIDIYASVFSSDKQFVSIAGESHGHDLRKEKKLVQKSHA